MPAVATTPRQCMDGLYMFFARADAFLSSLIGNASRPLVPVTLEAGPDRKTGTGA